MSKKIVIVGGGYAGVLTAKKLIKLNKKAIKNNEVEITLIDKLPYHTLMTELHEVAYGRTSNEAIKIYYKKIFNPKMINVVLDTITSIDYDSKKVCGLVDYEYDYLVEATGAKPAFFGVPGAEEFSQTMWSYKDAIDSKNHIINMFNRAEIETDPEMRRQLLTFVVAGAGFTGVEVVGELNEWINRTLIYKYPTINPDDINVYVIDGSKRILNAFGDKAASLAQRKMDRQGIITICNSFIKEVKADEVIYGNDQSLKTNTVIWTSGVTVSTIQGDAHELAMGGRIPVSGELSIIGKSDAYCLGDIMYYIPEGEERAVPQMVENCEHAAPLVASNITAKINGTQTKPPYNPAFHGAMACIGSRTGVAEIKVGDYTFVYGFFFALLMKHMINYVYLIPSAGLKKSWAYTKEEFFNVEDRRSLIGGHLSASSPSIYLVPLRIWLGLYWFRQGFPKIMSKLTGGLHSVCVDTEVFPATSKNYGAVCEQLVPAGQEEYYQALYNVDPTKMSPATAEYFASNPNSIPDVEGATTVVAHSGNIFDQASAMAHQTVENFQATATLANVMPDGSTYVFNQPDMGMLNDLAYYIDHIAPTSGFFGLQYALQILPDWLVNALLYITTYMLTLMGGTEWIMEFIFDGLETVLGLLLIVGLFIPFASVALVILALTISIGSLANFGLIVEGLFWSIFAAIALIGIGGRDAQPLSIDYYIKPIFKNRDLKKRKR